MKTRAAIVASLAVGLLATLSAGSAIAESKAVTKNPRIAFADQGAISNWRADRDQGLWVQAQNRQWYYATFMAPCTGLNFAHTIGFDTGPVGSLDQWSAVVVPRWGKCSFRSFEPSEGPPSKRANG